MKRILTISLSFLIIVTLSAQSLRLDLSVPKDSLKIGEWLEVSLRAEHNESKELFFPDDKSNYGKWEFVSKKVFPSYYTTDSLVTDSAVYYLRTFDISDSLPIFLDVYSGNDSILTRTKVKWIYHNNGVIEGKGNQILSDHTYEEIPKLFDEQIIIAIAVILALLAGYVFLVLLPKYLKKKRIEKFIKKHDDFLASVDFNSSWSNDQWGEYYSAWKKDISNSEKKNIQGYTSRKLADHFNDKNLSLVFRKLEQILYAPDSKVILEKSDFERLVNLSERKYLNQLTDMKNDK